MANEKLVTLSQLSRNNDKIKEELNKKIDVKQGVNNINKILQVNAEGNLALVDMPDEVKISQEEGNAIVKKDDGLYVATPEEIKISEKENNQLTEEIDGLYVPSIDLTDYTKTEDVETLIDEAQYTTSVVSAHYEITDSTTENALEVVADGTATDGQIDISSVTPLLDGITVSDGDYVIWVEAVTTKDEIYARKNDVYNKPEIDAKIAEVVTGGEIDLSEYVKHEEVEVMTEEELLTKIGLSEEELEGLATVISDTEIRTDKTYSSSKIYTELQKILTESKTYTLEEISKKTGASYKIATSTADMTSTEYIYLLANGDTYDMYIVETDGSEPVKIGTTDIDLSDYYTIEKIDNLYALKTTVGDLSTLSTTNKKSIVDAINEFYSIVPKTYATKTEVGDIGTMKTNDKTSIVNAINELSIADYNATKTYATKTDVGDLTVLKTNDKTSIVNAINENFNSIYDANKKHATKTEVGDLTILKTDDKDSVVDAINEAWGIGYNVQKAANNLTQNLSNSNLIDNSNFKINQRGLTEYTNAGYVVDRWRLEKYSSVATVGKVIVTDSGITLTSNGNGLDTYFRQEIANGAELVGKTVTISLKATELTGEWAINQYGNSTSTSFTSLSGDGILSATFKWIEQDYYAIQIYNRVGSDTLSIEWIKLELGSMSTIYIEPNYAEELLKIQSMNNDGTTKLTSNDSMPTILNSAMISNPNLLDNPDFSINQRGLAEYEVASKTYTVDRWKTANVPSLIIPRDKQITIQRHPSQNSSYSSLGQVVEKMAKGTYTFSIDIVSIDDTVPNIVMRVMDWADIANGVAGTYYALKSIINSEDIIGRHSLTFELPEDKENVYIYIYGSNLTAEDSKFTIANAKLEVGSVATPYVAPHPAEELAKCQRYYQTLGNEVSSRQAIVCIAQSPSWAPLGHIFPVEMKRQPTVTLTYLAKWNKSSESLDLDTTAILHNVTSKGIANLWSESNLLETSNAYYVKYTASAEL